MPLRASASYADAADTPMLRQRFTPLLMARMLLLMLRCCAAELRRHVDIAADMRIY